MKNPGWAALWFLGTLAAGPSPAAAGGPPRETLKVLQVVDGDTFQVDYRGRKERLRLIGLDTPELDHRDRPWEGEAPWQAPGLRVRNFVRSRIVPGKEYAVEWDVERRDKYGRLLGYLYLPDGVLLNELLLAEGLAALYTFPPNVRYVERFRKAARRARQHRRGFWECLETR